MPFKMYINFSFTPPYKYHCVHKEIPKIQILVDNTDADNLPLESMNFGGRLLPSAIQFRCWKEVRAWTRNSDLENRLEEASEGCPERGTVNPF